MVKKVIYFLLALSMMFTFCFTFSAFGADEEVKSKLIKIEKKFPDEKYWNHMGKSENNSDSVTDVPCTCHGGGCTWSKSCYCNKFDNATQCMGYAYKIAYEIVGVSAREFTKSYSLSSSKLRVGDVIRYKWDTHSITVTGVKGNTISFTDANWTGKCQIRWSTIDLSELKGFSYVLHYEGNNMKNSDLDFLKDKDAPEYNPDYRPNNTEKWTNTSDSGLNIRAKHSTESGILGSVPSGLSFYVTDHYTDGEYLWGKVQYGDTKGWCALNWAKYIDTKGKCDVPSFEDVKNTYTGKNMTLSWKGISGADSYVLYIYNAKGELINTYKTKKKKYTFELQKSGKYSAVVEAESSFALSWQVKSEKKSFKFELYQPKTVTDITMENKLTLVCGGSKTLVTKALPVDADNRELTYKSSNTAVASVDKNGKITAKGCGRAIITVKSKDSGGYSEKCAVTVKPDKVKNLKQASSNGKDSFTVQWSKVKGATYYYVYQYKNGQYKNVLETKETSAVMKNALKYVNYRFKVIAVYEKGDTKIKGAFSDVLKTTL